jgi:hypothetical protein
MTDLLKELENEAPASPVDCPNTSDIQFAEHVATTAMSLPSLRVKDSFMNLAA